jgi:nicotinamide-nucleotide amidase
MNAARLSRAIGKLLTKKHMTVSVCESCTGGMLGSMITEIPGSSRYFIGGVIAYADRIKKLVGVKAATLHKEGAVSERTAREMAQGVRRTLKTDIGVSVTGIAGPTGGSEEKPVGLVYVGLATAKSCLVEHRKFRGSRNTIRKKACLHALEMLCVLLKQ